MTCSLCNQTGHNKRTCPRITQVATTGKYAGLNAIQIEAIFAERERKNYEELVAPIIAATSRVNSQELEDKVSNYIHKEDDESKAALFAFVNGAAKRDEGWGKHTWFEYTDDELMTLAGDFLEEDNQQTKTDLIQFIIRYVMQ
jgi:hypothetical protein